MELNFKSIATLIFIAFMMGSVMSLGSKCVGYIWPDSVVKIEYSFVTE